MKQKLQCLSRCRRTDVLMAIAADTAAATTVASTVNQQISKTWAHVVEFEAV
jgi:pseudouridine-5'-phosphate glycosidase